jgi:hypothetical protein
MWFVTRKRHNRLWKIHLDRLDEIDNLRMSNSKLRAEVQKLNFQLEEAKKNDKRDPKTGRFIPNTDKP